MRAAPPLLGNEFQPVDKLSSVRLIVFELDSAPSWDFLAMNYEWSQTNPLQGL
jgi:hypothetical protein